MEGKLNVLTGQNGVEVCRRIDFQPCGTGNRVGLLSGSNREWLAKSLLILCIKKRHIESSRPFLLPVIEF